jgi:hypothetical protein
LLFVMSLFWTAEQPVYYLYIYNEDDGLSVTVFFEDFCVFWNFYVLHNYEHDICLLWQREHV